MSSAEPVPSVSARVPHPATPRHVARPLRRDVTARRWAVGVLGVATALALGWSGLLVLAGWVFASAYGLATRQSVTVDVLGVARDLAPALLVGWCLGLAAAAALGRGEALGARLAGATAGLLGGAAGAAVLALGPLL